MDLASPKNHPLPIRSVAVVTSVHPPFDKRIWKHCRALASNGIDVHLVCPWDVAEGPGPAGVTFYPFACSRSLLGRVFLNWRQIARHTKRLVSRVDILHIHDPDLLPLAAWLSSRVAGVYDCHENFGEEIRLRPYVPRLLKPMAGFAVERVERALARRVGRVVMAAPSQRRQFDFPGIRSILIGNLASGDLLKSVKQDWSSRSPALVFIGAQHERNGSLLFLEIAARLRKRYPDLRYIVSDRFSDLMFRDQYVQVAANLKLADRLDLVPSVPAHEIMRVLNSATIAVNPNLRVPQQIKGNHTKMYEFMAAGLPVVASDLPDQLALIEQCRSGLSARPEEVDSFVEQIARLLTDDELRLSLGRNAQQAFAERYQYETQIPALLQFYGDAVLEARRRMHPENVASRGT